MSLSNIFSGQVRTQLLWLMASAQMFVGFKTVEATTEIQKDEMHG
jgi:hypothetical protein